MRAVLAIGVLVAAVFVSGCTTAKTDTSTPEGFVSKLQKTLSRDGQVYHARIEGTMQAPGGQPQPMAAYELWLDLPGERYRLEFTKSPEWKVDLADHWVEIGTEERTYVAPDGDRASETTHAGSPACLPGDAPQIVGRLVCGLLVGDISPGVSQAKVEEGGERHGTKVTELVITRPTPPGDAGEHPTPEEKDRMLTFRFAVDAKSFAPLGTVMVVDQRGQELGHAETVIEGEFMAAGSLASDFFSPAAIGYISPSDELTRTLDAVQRDRPVYWLGRSVAPGNGLPVLTLDRAWDVRSNKEQSAVKLFYPSVTVDLWTGAAWNSYWSHIRGATPFGSRCAQAKTFQPGDGRTIEIIMSYFREGREVSGQVTVLPAGATPVLPTPGPYPTPTPHACPEGQFETFMAIVTMPDASVVTINATRPLLRMGDEKPGPFDSLSAMTALATAIHERQIGE